MDDSKESVQQLVESFKAGGTEVFDKLIELYSAKLYQAAYGILGNRQDAEEVVQDTFVRAYKGLNKFRGDASFETWIYRIAVNLSRNKYHWNRRRGSEINLSISQPLVKSDDTLKHEDMDITDKSSGPDSIIEKDEFEKNIAKAFEMLPENLRETMILRHVDDMPYEQIAELLECKVGTVKSRIARGREYLRQILKNIESGLPVDCDFEEEKD